MEMESADDEVMPTEASVDEGMMELEGMQPEMQMLDQYVQQVVQMIQAGASEQEVIEMLMQAGLDEEDINAIFQAVLEVLEGGMQANPIDDQLAQIS
jgi:flagellar motor component MotA